MNSKVSIDINKVECLDCNNIFYESIQDEFENCPYCNTEIDYRKENYQILDTTSIDFKVDFKTGKIIR